MPIQKQNLNVNFAQGLDTKTDPNQLAFGNFLELENQVFTKSKLLQKRNGFEALTSLGSTNYKYVNTFNGNLTAIGSSLSAYSTSSNSWVTKGAIVPLQLDTLPLVRTSSNQSKADSGVASNGLICTTYSEASAYKYVIANVETGQNIVSPTTISTPTEPPRVFVLGNYFIILYSESANLKYISIPINNPSSPNAAATLVTNYLADASLVAFDGVVSNNNIYVAYNASDGGGAIRMTYMNSFLVRQTAATGVSVTAGKAASTMSICVDSSGVSPIIWAVWYVTAGTTGWVRAVDQNLNSILAATQIISAGTILNITSTATAGSVTAFFEVSNTYSYGGSLATNFINSRSVTTGGVVGAAVTILRSVGLASKAFLMGTTSYMLSAYSSSYQPSYFLINGSGNFVAKLAYSNGGGYLASGLLPSVTLIDTTAHLAYLIKDLIIAANKNQSPTSSTPVFTQTGINLAKFNFTTDEMNAVEIGGSLHISGGFVWDYDGYQIVEDGFNLYPDNVVVTTSTSGGNLKDQTYYYVAIYEWSDNQGNIYRSAPSLAVQQITTGGDASTNTIKIPTLRLTYKTQNPVKIVLYRWSADNQTYYQITSLTSPTLNSTTTDSVTITDTLADASIVGNSILYTTGGVIENIGPPGANAMTLFKSRFFLIDAEDKNLLWYSKQVIESTPVEMSDLFTIYVAPTVSAQGNTGPMRALSSMDDKLIIFKKNAIYYLTGTGPDNTGANNDFSDPVFITSTVGCENQNSIVFVPQGLMFQSDKGIWLLGRDLSTQYIGAPVEAFNNSLVLSALTVPGTNQVRFTLNSGEILVYDYFYNQWATFTGVSSLSSCLFEDLHTFIDSFGRVFQENPGSYLDGSNPVLIHFKTGWFNLAGLQGFQRAYFFYLLATYFSPHKLTIEIGYDYKESPNQIVIITPDNFNGFLGDSHILGDESPLGGNPKLEQWRIFFETQKCEAVQIAVTESFDASLGAAAGQGFTMSGLDFVVGVKSAYPRLPAARSAG